METATNQLQATEVGSNLSANISVVPTTPHSPGGKSESITRIDRKLYDAAVNGRFKDLVNVQNIENLLTPNKNTVLHIHLTSQATNNVSKYFVNQILNKGEGLVLLTNAKGETPLHMAARYGHSSIVTLLIESAIAFPQDIENGIGADKKLIRAKTHENDTALHEAVRYGHIEVVEILIEKDPDHSYSANNANETPLYLASERQYRGIVRKILEKMKSPAYDGPNGRTALHAAVINSDIEILKNSFQILMGEILLVRPKQNMDMEIKEQESSFLMSERSLIYEDILSYRICKGITEKLLHQLILSVCLD